MMTDGINAISRKILGRDVMGNSKKSKVYGRGAKGTRTDKKTGLADITTHYEKQTADIANKR